MKILKYCVLTFLVLIALGLVFWKQLTAMSLYLMAVYSFAGVAEIQIVPELYELHPTEIETVHSEIIVDHLQVPVVFIENNSDVGEHGYVALGVDKSIWVKRSNVELLNSIFDERISMDERVALCEGFGLAASTTNPCVSEYNFLHTLFSTSPEKTGWNSPANQKIGFFILTKLKASFGWPDKSIETEHLHGFLEQHDDVVTAIIFLADGTKFEITFIGYSQSEIDYTLAHSIAVGN